MVCCQGVKGLASVKLWEKGSTFHETGQSQSWNTNTSIFYVHTYEKEETETDGDTAGNAHTNQSCVFLKNQSHPFQSGGLQLLQVWAASGWTALSCLSHRSRAGVSPTCLPR